MREKNIFFLQFTHSELKLWQNTGLTLETNIVFFKLDLAFYSGEYGEGLLSMGLPYKVILMCIVYF